MKRKSLTNEIKQFIFENPVLAKFFIGVIIIFLLSIHLNLSCTEEHGFICEAAYAPPGLSAVKEVVR